MTAAPTTTSVEQWLEDRRVSCDMRVTDIARTRSREWLFDGSRIHHTSGAFFSIVGATVYAGGTRRPPFDQPLIDQPEIGILGFLISTVDQRLEILVQAKPEPGNVLLVQAAPSVQATKSNFTRRHSGKATRFLEHFLPGRDTTILAESLQSEQGSRFLGKYNRNVLASVAAPERPPDSPEFRWFPLDEVLSLSVQNFRMNTDARSVLASAPWRLLVTGRTPFSRWRDRRGTGEAFLRSFEAPEKGSVLSTAEIIGRLERLRSTAEFTQSVVGLTDLSGWEITDTVIQPIERKLFAIRQFEIESSEREVSHWDQPLVASTAVGHVVLLCQEHAGTLHFLFKAHAEIGFQEKFQYGPTIQRLSDERPIEPGLEEQDSFLEQMLVRTETLASSLQSDEGGRFFRSVSRYEIRQLPPDEKIELKANLSWITLKQVGELIRRQGFFSNEARSLVSMLLAYL
jgi:oxidase EvaA